MIETVRGGTHEEKKKKVVDHTAETSLSNAVHSITRWVLYSKTRGVMGSARDPSEIAKRGQRLVQAEPLFTALGQRTAVERQADWLKKKL